MGSAWGRRRFLKVRKLCVECVVSGCEFGGEFGGEFGDVVGDNGGDWPSEGRRSGQVKPWAAKAKDCRRAGLRAEGRGGPSCTSSRTSIGQRLTRSTRAP
jgi:hypothetical protein